MKSLIYKVVSRAAAPCFRLIHQNHPVVLMFHGFTDFEHPGCENSQHKHLHVKKFESFLVHLQQHYQIISLDQLVQCLELGVPAPERAVVLTFDDGFRSNYRLAFPLLKRFNAPATIYLATEFVDEGKPIWTDRIDYAFHTAGRSISELKAAKAELKKLPQEQIDSAVQDWESRLQVEALNGHQLTEDSIYAPLLWSQASEMRASGLITFGAHTHTHKILGRSHEETVRHELSRSKRLIEERLEHECVHFCYPNGSHGDFSELTERCVHEMGFKSSVTTLNGRIDGLKHGFLMPRLGITNDLDLSRFELMVSGFTAWLENKRHHPKSNL